jgi:hypothetical protein
MPSYLAGYNILIEAFPRDLEFRVNMASSGLMDVEEGWPEARWPSR